MATSTPPGPWISEKIVGYGGGRYEGFEFEDNRLTSRWIQGMNDAVWAQGVLRDVHLYNLLTARHLERDVGGMSLEAWIQAEAWHGRLAHHPPGYALWTVDQAHLLDARRALAARNALYVMGPDNHLGPLGAEQPREPGKGERPNTAQRFHRPDEPEPGGPRALPGERPRTYSRDSAPMQQQQASWVTDPGYYHRVSYRWNASAWLDEVEPPTQPLTEHLDVDVAVIGGGYTGLSSALALREEGLSVAVLESRLAGYGASGRNAGHLTPTIGKDLPTLAMLYGKARTSDLVRVAEAAVVNAESLIERHRIECDYEPVGNLFAAVHERQFKAVDKAAAAAERFGAPGRLLESEDLRREGMPRGFLRGFLEPSGGILNPAKFARGLRRAAMDAGVQVFEMTPVENVRIGAVHALSTPRGRVSARHLVVATNGYTRPLGLARQGVDRPNVARIAVQLFRTAPLSDADMEALDWRARAGVYTAHEVLESYRLTADNRIVGGSKVVRYGYGDRPLASVDEPSGERLEVAFRARFPEIAHVPVTEHWGGPIGFSLDFLPQVGRAGRHDNVFYAAGYCGHGVAQASYAGTMIRDLMLGRDGPGKVLWSRRSVAMPPEPLRWVVAQGLIKLFEAIDRRADR